MGEGRSAEGAKQKVEVNRSREGEGWPGDRILFFFLINLFILGCVGSSLLHTGFSLVVESGGYSSSRCVGFSLGWLLLLQSTGSRRAGFSSCGSRA